MEDNTSKAYVGPAASLPDDLLLASTGAGSSLFVINLCASIAPIPITGKTIAGLESYRLYQVARNEDGRTRHRLRLGFFTSEADAERILATVRSNYPTAFTTRLGNDDRKFARGFQPAQSAAPARQRPVAVETMPIQATKPAPITQSKPVVANPAAANTVAPKAAAAKPAVPAAAAPVKSKPVEVQSAAVTQAPAKPAAAIELTLAAETVATKQEPAPARAAPSHAGQPFHVGRGIEIPAMSLSLETQSIKIAAKPAATPGAPAASVLHKAAAAAAVAPVSNKFTQASVAPVSVAPRTHAAIPSRPTFDLNRRPLPELDSTQTIRALTSAELGDDSQEKWFAIQLAVSEQPVNLDAMPHLDIFEAYRLYSVAHAGSGKILHSLRIGFFREQVSAEAVCGYLKTFFASPSVLRISTAEQLRFKDAAVPKAIATAGNGSVAKNDARVIELNHARERSARPAIPTVTMEVTSPNGADRSPTGTFRTGATGTFKTSASGSYKANTTGSHQALNPTLKPAAKSAGPAIRRSPVSSKTSSTGKYKALSKKSLNQQLLDEARDVELSESAIRKLPKNDSLLARLVGRLTK